MVELAPLLIPFFVISAAVVLVGLSQSHTSQHGSTGSKSFVQLFLQNNILAQLFAVGAKASRYVISRFAASQLHMLAHWLKALGTLVIHSYSYQADQAVAAEKALQTLFTKGDTTARREAHKANTAAAHAATQAHRAQATALADAAALRRYKATTNPRLAHLTHATDVAIPHDIGQLRERNKALERDQTKTRDAVTSLEDGAIETFKWIRAHPLTATTGVFAGAVSIALARLGLGALRCDNFKNLLRNYGCGLGTLLGRLLPLAILLGTAFDFPEFVHAAEVVAEGIGEAVGKIEGTFSLSLPPLPPPE